MFTNSQDDIESVKRWQIAALADGWNHAPLYKNESEERAMVLEKNEFKAHIIYRIYNIMEAKRWLGEVSINIWGPDGLAIKAIYPYSWQSIVDGLMVCDQCDAKGVHTQRVGFANRVCANCLEKARAKFEYREWCD